MSEQAEAEWFNQTLCQVNRSKAMSFPNASFTARAHRNELSSLMVETAAIVLTGDD